MDVLVTMENCYWNSSVILVMYGVLVSTMHINYFGEKNVELIMFWSTVINVQIWLLMLVNQQDYEEIDDLSVTDLMELLNDLETPSRQKEK